MCGRESRREGKVAGRGRGAGMRATCSGAIYGGGAGTFQVEWRARLDMADLCTSASTSRLTLTLTWSLTLTATATLTSKFEVDVVGWRRPLARTAEPANGDPGRRRPGL